MMNMMAITKWIKSDRFPDCEDVYELNLQELVELRPMCGNYMKDGKIAKVTKRQINKIKPMLKSAKIYVELIPDLEGSFASLFLSCKKNMGEKIGKILDLRYDEGQIIEKSGKISDYKFFESE